MSTTAKNTEATLADVRLGVRGLTAREMQLLEGFVRLSARDTNRRMMRIALVSHQDPQQVDVLLVDAQDPDAMAWARQQGWLARKPVLWLDPPAQQVPPAGHTVVRRPVHWSNLSVLLSRALENGPRAGEPMLATTSPVADRRAHLLLVDDSAVARTQLRSLVAQRGCDTSEAASVDDALALVAQRRFDLVFMDVLMPGIDGYEGCRRVKAATRAAGEVPVVMLTSKASPFDRIRGKIAGCNAYLAKPVEARDLDTVIAQFAPGGQAEVHSAPRASKPSAPPMASGGAMAGAA